MPKYEQSPIKEATICPKLKQYTVDLSKAWDTVSQADLFLKKVHRLPFYKPGLLFSGFDAGDIGIRWCSDAQGIIFCSTEDELYGVTNKENAFNYANTYRNPAFAIYDPDKMGLDPTGSEGYIMKDPSALLTIIRIK